MKKLPRRMAHFKGITLGLDVHKKFIQCCVMDGEGNEVSNSPQASTTMAMEALLTEHLAHGAAVQVVMEASGCFLWLFDLAVRRLGRSRVQVAAPSRVRVIADSQEKNDANDAWWLAYLAYEGRLPQAMVAEGDLRELRIATRELRSITDERSDLKRRMKSHLAQINIGFPASDWHSQVGRARIGKIIAAVDAPRAMRGTSIKRLWDRIQSMDEEVLWWDEQVRRLSEKFGEIATMQKEIPGIGPVISTGVWSELGDPRRYRSAKAFAKATGLTPGYRSSGGRTLGGRITRQGSALVRWSLTRAVLVCMRNARGSGKTIATWVERRAKHKRKKLVIVAAARKLSEAIWRLYTLGEAFDVDHAFNNRRRKFAGASSG